MANLNPRLAVYPGTFDPVTLGHVSLVRRSRKLFDEVIFAIAESTPKNTLFSIEERVEMATKVFANDPGIIVEPFNGLLIDYVLSRKAGAVVRGLRAVSDFEYEFQMALMNRKLQREIETMFLMTDYNWMYLSSTIVKEVARHGGDIRGLVPECVVDKVYAKYGFDAYGKR